MSEWVPAVSVDVSQSAIPPFTGIDRIVTPLSRNVTMPEAIEGETVADKRTLWPLDAGFPEEVNVRFAATVFTVSTSAAERLLKLVPSPL